MYLDLVVGGRGDFQDFEWFLSSISFKLDIAALQKYIMYFVNLHDSALKEMCINMNWQINLGKHAKTDAKGFSSNRF